MVHSLLTELNFTSSKACYWTDTTIVLSWFQKPPCLSPTFVANRISYVLDTIGVDNCNHLESHHNPADLASRGMTAKELVNSNIWWKGSTWLSLPRSEWPKSSYKPCTQLEKRARMNVNTTTFTVLSTFSGFTIPLIKSISYLGVLVNETYSGRNQFREASINCFVSKFTLPLILNFEGKSCFASYLQPFIDSHGFLRVNGKLFLSPTTMVILLDYI